MDGLEADLEGEMDAAQLNYPEFAGPGACLLQRTQQTYCRSSSIAYMRRKHEKEEEV
jgi:hypothetical protein